MSDMALKYGMKKRMAKGGHVKGVNLQDEHRSEGTSQAGHYAKYETGQPHDNDDGSKAWTNGKAKEVHHKTLSELKSMPKPALPMAEGGEVHKGDIVERIMRAQAKMMSEGGMVANGGDDDLDRMADGDPNNFDDLAMRDDLEGHDTGADEGDADGDHAEDEDRNDVVAKIMKSRAKKDRNPRPA